MSEKRPNIVVFVSDDQGAWAMGKENPEIVSPRLDQLSDDGVVLDNFFCVSPVCSPARASLYTGLSPSQHGVHDHVREPHFGPESIDYLQGFRTFPDVLRQHGYRTGLVGKWHLGAADLRGDTYDEWYALPGGMDNYYDATVLDGSEVRSESAYLTEVLAQRSVEFVRDAAADERPFCLVVPFTAPHSPWVDQHPQRFVDLFEDTEFVSCPQEPVHPWGPTSRHPDMQEAVRNPRPSLVGYFASIAAMDEAIGDIVDAVDDAGFRDETIFVFLSDNGFSCGHHGVWGKGNATFPPNLFEESVRVPGILSWPGGPQGLRWEGLASAYDLYPTLLGLCGIEDPDYNGPGTDLVARISEASHDDTRSSDSDDYIVIYSEYGPARMIRTQTDKLVLRYPYGPNEYYVLSEDPGERDNRIDDRRMFERQALLRSRLDAWFESYAEPWADGRGAAITGAGQQQRMGSHGDGTDPFPLPLVDELPHTDIRELPVRSGGYFDSNEGESP